MKKIDDQVLQKMMAKNTQQKEIAKHFGVSESAISQRIKRLHQAAPPESFAGLSPKEQKFVLAKLEGKSSTAAALDAYNCSSVESAHTIGVRLAGDPDVNTAIHDLMHQEGIGRRVRVKRLRDVINAADLGVVSRGLDMANKLTGEYAPEKIDVNEQRAAVHMLIAEIKSLKEE
ncbi:MAG: HTH domain-containing protein [Syntrophales bacterium LBB04]|nr:HTH domain-containing protein [Syntrophales bacterium LBB04]